MTCPKNLNLAALLVGGLLVGCLHEPTVSAGSQDGCTPPVAGEQSSQDSCTQGEMGGSVSIDPADRSSYPGLLELEAIVEDKRQELYGTQPGDRIEALSFVDGDNQAFGLADIYKDDTRKLLLMTTSAGWCAACIEEQPTLQGLHEEFGDQGLSILVVLFEYQDYSPADARLAKQWKQRYNLDFSVVADEDFISKAYYPNGDASATPLVMLIDVANMTIIDVTTGFNEDVVRSIIDKVL